MPSSDHYRVWLFSQQRLGSEVAEEVARWFVRCSGPVQIEIRPRAVELEINSAGQIDWGPTFATLRRLRSEHRIPDDDFIFLLTTSPNSMNWYAAENPEHMRDGFGHVGDFGWVTTAPSSVICAHYILKAIFNALVVEAGLSWRGLMHDDPRGCFYDFCPEKRQLNLKLRTADICGDCLEVFGGIGIPDALLRQVVGMMELQRTSALATARFRTPEPVFSIWPTPVAITRHKAVQASNPLLRFLLLLDHFDSLVRYFYLAHEVVNDRAPTIEERPSLGWWVEQMARCLRGERHFREIVRIAEQEKIVVLRNERRAHGWMSANIEGYETEAQHLEEALTLIEAELQPFLEKYQLVIPHQISLRAATWVIEGENLSGSNALYPQFTTSASRDPREIGLIQQGDVYITDTAMEGFRRMSPYIRYALCPECRHQRVLIIDGKDTYIDIFVGHRTRIPSGL